MQTNYGGSGNKGKRILVAYASRCGSTGEAAQAIGEVLSGPEVAVDVKPIKAVTSVADYQAVVVGSAIRVGQWLGEAKRFVNTHQDALRQMPTACFSVCVEFCDGAGDGQCEPLTCLATARERLDPAAVTHFLGVIDLAKMSFLERGLTRVLGAQDSDQRDWEAIRAWAVGLQPALAG